MYTLWGSSTWYPPVHTKIAGLAGFSFPPPSIWYSMSWTWFSRICRLLFLVESPFFAVVHATFGQINVDVAPWILINCLWGHSLSCRDITIFVGNSFSVIFFFSCIRKSFSCMLHCWLAPPNNNVTISFSLALDYTYILYSCIYIYIQTDMKCEDWARVRVAQSNGKRVQKPGKTRGKRPAFQKKNHFHGHLPSFTL